MVVGPGLFETVREQFDRRRTLARPCEEAERRSAESTNRPKKFRHIFFKHSFILRIVEPFSVGCRTREGCFIRRGDFWEAAGGHYNRRMDSGRLGRVLGIGTRLAAKTLVQAVDAATAPNPSAQPKQSKAEKAGRAAAARVAETASRLRVS